MCGIITENDKRMPEEKRRVSKRLRKKKIGQGFVLS